MLHPMSNCLICTNDTLGQLPLHDKDVRMQVARDLISGMTSGLQKPGICGSMQKLGKRPPRRGTCIVERCALEIEISCGRCGKIDCLRCSIAAELRAAEDRINTERDAELDAMGIDENDLELAISNILDNLCATHTLFGSALAEQWYGRQNFAEPTIDQPVS